MIPTNLNFGFSRSKIGNLKQRLLESNVVLDTSQCTSFNNTFYSSAVTHLGVIDARNATDIYCIFEAAAYLISIDKIILRDGEYQSHKYAFERMTRLQNIEIEGKIHFGGNMSYSASLSKSSITSVVNALSEATTGLTWTFSLVAVNNAFGSDTAQEWLDLMATKPNWTISLA